MNKIETQPLYDFLIYYSPKEMMMALMIAANESLQGKNQQP